MKIDKCSLIGDIIICLFYLAWAIYYFVTGDITFGAIFCSLTFVAILFTLVNIVHDYTQQLHRRIRNLEKDVTKLMENQQ